MPRIPPAPPPVPRRKLPPVSIPGPAGLAAIIREACGHSPDPALLAGLAGLHGVLGQWAPYLVALAESGMNSRTLEAANPLAQLTGDFVAQLDRLARDLPPAWSVMIAPKLAELRRWREGFPWGEPRTPPLPWHQAARALRDALVEAWQEGGPEAGELPSDRRLAEAVRALLGLMHLHMSAERVRHVLAQADSFGLPTGG